MSSTTTPTTTRADIATQQYDAQAFGNSDVIKAAQAQLLSAMALNKSNATLWLMFFDAASVPSNGAVPVMQPIQLAAGQQVAIDLNDGEGEDRVTGLQMSTGLCWAASTTSATLTVDASSSTWVTVRYV